MLRIGIDVGGTNTDAALLDESTVVATSKAASTDDTVCGIVNVLQRLRMKALQSENLNRIWVTIMACSGTLVAARIAAYLLVLAFPQSEGLRARPRGLA